MLFLETLKNQVIFFFYNFSFSLTGCCSYFNSCVAFSKFQSLRKRYEVLDFTINLMTLNSREQMRGYKIWGCQSVVITLWFRDTDVFSNLTGHELSDIKISSFSSLWCRSCQSNWFLLFQTIFYLVKSCSLTLILLFISFHWECPNILC